MTVNISQTLSPEQAYLAIGEVTSLLAQSPLHQNRSIGHIGELIVPPMTLGQIRIWRGPMGPVGFAIWAWLDAETEARVLEGDHILTPDEWNCGACPVVVDFVAPFGNGFRMARELSREVFPERALKSVRRDDDGNIIRIVQWPGRDESGVYQSAAAIAA